MTEITFSIPSAFYRVRSTSFKPVNFYIERRNDLVLHYCRSKFAKADGN